MSPWLAPSRMDRREAGNWTLVITCIVVEPVEMAASTESAGTPRIPSATMRITTGAA